MHARAQRLGERAIVIGGSIAGTLVARVLADHFNLVSVIERDVSAGIDGLRNGPPHARQAHILLRGGIDSVNALFPEFEQDLYRAGAVRTSPARDVVVVDGFGEWPRVDIGIEVPMQRRSLIDRVLQRRLSQQPNVHVLGDVTVQALIRDGERVVGVKCRYADGSVGVELGDLIVDASGRSSHATDWLARLGFVAPEETRIEVDIGYAGCFIRPRRTPSVLGAMVIEPAPTGRHNGLAIMQEHGCLSVAIGSRGRDVTPAADYAQLLAQAERLPHPIVFELMRDAQPLEPVTRFGFPASVQRHYERLERLPESFLSVGDAICSFNPIWGQGMSVAALEAVALRRLIEACASDRGSVRGLGRAFYAEAARIIAVPWMLSAAPDLAYDTSRGQRSAVDPEASRYALALTRLAQRDTYVRAKLAAVYHLLEPISVLEEPAMRARVMQSLES